MRRTLPALLWAIISFYLFAFSSAAQEAEAKDDAPKHTIFNWQEVPPMAELSGETYKEQISTGYWLVEAFSPYCVHCQQLAPKLQTIYEFYYTSDPLPVSKDPPGDSLNTFSRYYDIKFAKLNCIAFGTACGEIGVTSYPSLVLFKNGEELKRMKGDSSMEELGKFMEEALEIIRPGSRQLEGITFPSAGDKEFHPKEAPKEAAKEAAKPASAPSKETIRPTNIDGVSLPLNAESFKTLQEQTLDPWFIKFYSPWCPHCQRMAATWTAMAREMKGKLNVGEVNCNTEEVFCAKMRIASYPTVRFFRGPEDVLYEGLRGLGDFVDFANQGIAAAAVKQVTATEFEELEKTDDVIFVYFYDHATTTEDFTALERLPLTLIGKGKIVKTDDIALARRFNVFTWPRLLVVRDGKVDVFDESSPQHMRNVTEIRTWMKTVWLPLLPELSAANAGSLMSAKKIVVLGILSRERREEFAVARREIKSAAMEWMEREEKTQGLDRQVLRDAKQLRIDEAEAKNDKNALEKAKAIQVNTKDEKRQEVAFAWVDGVFWEHWITSTFGMSVKHDGEKVVIYDELNRRYWDTTSAGKPIVPSHTSILETLTQIYTDPRKIRSKPLDPRFIVSLRRYGRFVVNHPILTTIGGTVGLVVMLATTIKGRRHRRRSFGTGGFFKLEEKGGNGSAYGKVD